VTSIITRTAQVTVTNAVPSAPAVPIPIDGAVDQPFNTPLSWAASTDLNCDNVTYDIAFGTSPTPPVVATGLTTPNFTPGTLLPGTTYYWFVIAHDGLAETPGPTWSFTTSTLKIFLPIAIK
jgi:hypothetical protein